VNGPGLPAVRLGRVAVALTAMAAASGLGVAWLHPLWAEHLATRCPLLAIFGIPCVTCGGTRAMVALVTGDAIEALAWNPLVALGGLAAIAWLPLALLMLGGLIKPPRMPAILPVAGRGAIVGALALNWAYLLLWFRG